jgi:hypothetical protein
MRYDPEELEELRRDLPAPGLLCFECKRAQCHFNCPRYIEPEWDVDPTEDRNG